MTKIDVASPVCFAPEDELFACAAPQAFKAEQYRKDFPILGEIIHGKPLVYLDNAASTQKPRMVIEGVQRFLEHDYSNIHRGVHELSVRATNKYEAARETVRKFIHAARSEEIVFVRNGTEAINLVAATWGRATLKEGDEVVVTTLEHHSNIVPWQMLREEKGIKLRVVPVTDAGEIRIEDVKAVLSPRTKMVAVAHVSNVLGTVLPVAEIIQLAHGVGAKVLIDGCQAVARIPVDVQALDADFYVFSGHKLYGPTGVGVLYGKQALLNAMPPYQGGGGMIASVTFEETTYRESPARFEAGTPAITEAVGLAAAIDYVSTIGIARIGRHEDELLAYATDKLRSINSISIVGGAETKKPVLKAGVLSFTMQGAHPHDIGTILDRHGIAIRAGHHCAQPLMEWFGVPATARASFGLYNTLADVDALVEGLEKVREIFA
jgi:cysteine desulfurase/selenocysteine lyase